MTEGIGKAVSVAPPTYTGEGGNTTKEEFIWTNDFNNFSSWFLVSA